MCGIAGIWGNASTDRLNAMAAALGHRGPDGQRIWHSTGSDVGFAHTRLSIIDIPGGAQPISDESGAITTIFNGEIYNYVELREELIARGHRLATQSDTEVIVHLYEETGEKFLSRLRGMFAIALWDENRKTLLLARDRVGKKPLYYAQHGSDFLFASEIKGLVAGISGRLELNMASIAQYLKWGCIPAPETIYQHVRSVLPGELLIIRNQTIADRRRYWRLDFTPKSTLGCGDAVQHVDALLREAVRIRLRSDVPVGSFLSGGIDSGIITAMAAQESSSRLTTLTVGFPEARFDERPLARLMARRYGTDHHEIVIEPDLANDLPRIVQAYDQPFADSSAIPSYYVARAARSLVKVALNGDGGDELFAGYRRHVAAWLSRFAPWRNTVAGQSAARALLRVLTSPQKFRSRYAFAHRLLRGLASSPADRYHIWATDFFDEAALREITARSGRSWMAAFSDSARPALPWPAGSAERDSLGTVDQFLARDFDLILPNDLLVKMDIASMAHGLEVRSPLLDHVVCEAAARLPESVKLGGMTTKPVLRLLSDAYVPASVRDAPKRGFEVPLVQWLRGPLHDPVRDVLLSQNGLLGDLFDRRALASLIDARDLDPAQWARRVWAVYMLGMWDQHVRG